MSDEQRADAQHYRYLAENIRQLARQSHISRIREEMFDLAERLEQMAEAVEKDGSRPAGHHL